MNFKYRQSRIKLGDEEFLKTIGISIIHLILLFTAVIAIILFRNDGFLKDSELKLFWGLSFIISITYISIKSYLAREILSIKKQIKLNEYQKALEKLNKIRTNIYKKQGKNNLLYKYTYVELRSICYFEFLKLEYNNDFENRLNKLYEEALDLLHKMKLKEERAYMYYNKAMMDEMIYKFNKSREYKIKAKKSYQKAIGLSADQEFIKMAKKRLVA
ncbi:hypothetical protein WG909_07690 [Peptostreptococcaceae bacterium AGR-M142]